MKTGWYHYTFKPSKRSQVNENIFYYKKWNSRLLIKKKKKKKKKKKNCASVDFMSSYRVCLRTNKFCGKLQSGSNENFSEAYIFIVLIFRVHGSAPPYDVKFVYRRKRK